ncbi:MULTISPECIES: hypothetical protein [unclassified Haematobacter]|uniref:hypothetical protein n=1 Tax=unclassified Haematobacter TaxID=2640585 RepID=UPI0025C6614F|nr:MULTISPECIES: hypothetical protein [unclassified Haematobacter]
MAKITVKQLEEKILDLEEIVLVIRAAGKTQVEDYEFERKSSKESSVSDWIEGRLKKSINDLEFQIVSGDGTKPHGRTKLKKLRESYSH